MRGTGTGHARGCCAGIKEGFVGFRNSRQVASGWSLPVSYLPQHMPTSCGVCTTRSRRPDDLGCSVCAAKLAQGEGFTCQTCGFNLCLRCALPHRHSDDASPSKRPPPPPTEASVAVDVGARRLWLSDDIRFVGNAATILDESLPLLDALGKALKAHPGVAVRLEGHTNSKCGLECDGKTKCENSACRKNRRAGAAPPGFRSRGRTPCATRWSSGTRSTRRASRRGASPGRGGWPSTPRATTSTATGASRCTRQRFCEVLFLPLEFKIC